MIYNKIERDLVITKQIFNYYNNNLLLEVTSKVLKVGQNRNIYTQTSDDIFILCFQHSRNGTHRIVGYQRQWRIHLCCLQKSTRWRHLRRQEVKLTLDLNVPCRPTMKCVLWGQHEIYWTQCIIQWVFESRAISVSRLFWTVCFELVQNMIQQFVAE